MGHIAENTGNSAHLLIVNVLTWSPHAAFPAKWQSASWTREKLHQGACHSTQNVVIFLFFLPGTPGWNPTVPKKTTQRQTVQHANTLLLASFFAVHGSLLLGVLTCPRQFQHVPSRGRCWLAQSSNMDAWPFSYQLAAFLHLIDVASAPAPASARHTHLSLFSPLSLSLSHRYGKLPPLSGHVSPSLSNRACTIPTTCDTSETRGRRRPIRIFQSRQEEKDWWLSAGHATFHHRLTGGGATRPHQQQSAVRARQADLPAGKTGKHGDGRSLAHDPFTGCGPDERMLHADTREVLSFRVILDCTVYWTAVLATSVS